MILPTSHRNSINKMISAFDLNSLRSMLRRLLACGVRNMLRHFPATSSTPQAAPPTQAWMKNKCRNVCVEIWIANKCNASMNFMDISFRIEKRFACKSKRNKFVAPGFWSCCLLHSCFSLFLIVHSVHICHILNWCWTHVYGSTSEAFKHAEIFIHLLL